MQIPSRRLGFSARFAAAFVALFVLAACGAGSGDTELDTEEPAGAELEDAVEGSSEGEAVEAQNDDDEFELPANIWPAEVDDPSTSDDGGGGGAEDDDGEFVLPPNIWPAEVDDPVEDDTESAATKAVVTRSVEGSAEGVSPEGLTTVTARVTAADGEVCEVCLWLADSSAERSTGLMGVTDLGGPVGMAFVWNGPHDGRFFMLDTPTPLSIAWFDESGEHVGQTDMAPCLTDDSSECERYGADAPYTIAVEMFEGQLGVVGIGPGATVELVAGTESATCLLDA